MRRKLTNGKRDNISSLQVSVQAWPTPQAHDANTMGASAASPFGSLARDVMTWITPTAQDSQATHRMRDDHQNNLAAQGATWPTPTANEAEHGGESRASKLARKSGGVTLTTAARDEWPLTLWPTPKARDWKGGGDPEKAETRHSPDLDRTVELWRTPSASEAHAGPTPLMQPMITQQAEAFPQDPPTPPAGSASSSETPSSRRRLNPRFVEWLMGWPAGWLSLEPISYEF